MEAVSDPGLQKSFYSHRITFKVLWGRSGWQGCLCPCAAEHLLELWAYVRSYPNIFNFICRCSVLIHQKTAAQMSPGQSISHLKKPEDSVVLISVMDENVGYMYDKDCSQDQLSLLFYSVKGQCVREQILLQILVTLMPMLSVLLRFQQPPFCLHLNFLTPGTPWRLCFRQWNKLYTFRNWDITGEQQRISEKQEFK